MMGVYLIFQANTQPQGKICSKSDGNSDSSRNKRDLTLKKLNELNKLKQVLNKYFINIKTKLYLQMFRSSLLELKKNKKL